MENLYNYIEETAKKCGYKNITEYCKSTGIPRATMSELKAGRTKKLSAKTAQVIFNTLQIPLNTLLGIDAPAEDAAEPITEHFGVSHEYFSDKTEKSPAPTKSAEDFLKVYELLTPDRQAQLREKMADLLKEQLQG